MTYTYYRYLKCCICFVLNNEYIVYTYLNPYIKYYFMYIIHAVGHRNILSEMLPYFCFKS